MLLDKRTVKLLKNLSCFLFGCKFIAPVSAQIIPDQSLGNEKSTVNSQAIVNNKEVDLITGGAIRDRNLFHSFTEFNVGHSGVVYFAAPDTITNILSRVTGNNGTQILGTLGVDGTANLFLLNPKGIIFGENASLDLRGSFMATTAESYIFDDGSSFGTVNLQLPSLLAVNIPVGVQFGQNSSQIVNYSRFSGISDLSQGLSIMPQKTLSLIGGEVLLEGGVLSTETGNIDIASVAPDSKVSIISAPGGWNLSFEGVTSFKDIAIKGEGKIDGGDLGGSEITLTGKNIALGYDLKSIAKLGYGLEDFFTLEILSGIEQLPKNLAEITADNLDNETTSQIFINASETFSLIQDANINADTKGTGDAGNIQVNANTVVLYYGEFESANGLDSIGNAGKITFNANHMSVQNGGGGVNALGSGDGGIIDLDIAQDLKIQFGGFGADTYGSGDGGRIEIDANNLEIISGGAGVNTLGSGNGGTIDLNIRNELRARFGGFGADTVASGDGGKIIINAKIIDFDFAGLGVNARNEGNGGEIDIKAETISLSNGSIGSESGQNLDDRDFDVNQLQERFGQKNAGQGGIINIEADTFKILDQGKVATTTFGSGNAGIINLKVGSLELEGDLETFISSSTNASGSGGNIAISADEITIAEEANITASSTQSGSAGDILLYAKDSIRLQDHSQISVDGGEIGESGNINLSSGHIDIIDNSIISARVNLGDKGNIALNANSLFLDDQSEINTNAFLNPKTGDELNNDATGGDISIDLRDNLVMKSSSKIVANAFAGEGGNIQIQTRGFFTSFDSIIAASSMFGLDGTVNINSRNANTRFTEFKLPDRLVDPGQYLTAGCSAENNYNFVGVGRGGLPASPFSGASHSNDLTYLPDLAIFQQTPQDKVFSGQDNIPHFFPSQTKVSGELPVEAGTWKLNRQGQVELVAQVQQPTDQIAGNHPSCFK